jgi:hypothetical protein
MNGQKKPRRRRWAPTGDTMWVASYHASKLSPADVGEVMQPLQDACRALREGVASEWHWSLAASAVNTARAIERQGVVKGLHEHLVAADLALAGIHRRAMLATGWRPTALYYLELDAITTAVELHEFQLRQLSRGEMMRAVALAQADIQSSGGRVIHLSAAPATHHESMA